MTHLAPATVERLVSEALAIQEEDARKAGTLGYMARGMVQATMPHRKTAETLHERRNGNYFLSMSATRSDIGLPFGSVPRLLLAWIGAETMRTGEPELILGDSMSAFLAELGLNRTGGRWGDVTRLKDQSRRLFSCSISCSYTVPDERDELPAPFGIGHASLWWNPKSPDQSSIFRSTLTLSDRFYREITEHPVPVDMRALKALKRSPLALDVYAWLVWRVFTLNRADRSVTLIPWEGLQMQFGSSYAMTGQGCRDFKRAFLRELQKVKAFYPEASTEPTAAGLQLSASPEHIASRPSRRPHLVSG